MTTNFDRISEADFEKEVKAIKAAVLDSDRSPIVILGRSGVGKTPILNKIGKNYEHCEYGLHAETKKGMLDFVKSVEREQATQPNIQIVVTITDEKLFARLQLEPKFRCFQLRFTTRQSFMNVFSRI